MASNGVSDDLREEAEKIVQKFTEQELMFCDYYFKMTPSHFDIDFAELVADQDGGISELKPLLPDIGEDRLSYIFENPDKISQAELHEWIRNRFFSIPDDATTFVFVPIETANSAKGIAVIMDWGNPGGEYELFDVFENQEETDKALEGTFWF